MPNLENAKKALRVSDRKRILNDKRRKAVKETTKAARSVIGAEKKVVIETLSKAYKAIHKAAKRGIIKKNTANRRKARLSKALKPAK